MYTVSGIRTSNPTHRATVDLRLRPHGHRDMPQSRTVQTVHFTEHFKNTGYSFGPSLFQSFSTLSVFRTKYLGWLINDELKGYGSNRSLIEVLFHHLRGAPEETKESQKICCTGWDSNQAPPKQMHTATPLHQPITNDSNDNNNSNSYRLFINAKYVYPRTTAYLLH